jgi:hypothetical protein
MQDSSKTIDYKSYFDRAISYRQYLANFQAEIDMGDKSKFAEYLPQNWSRQSRLDRKIKLREDLISAIDHVDQPSNWLVITEHWCGDASQINPVINKIAELSSGKINLKFIYRDENEELIDAHLTDGRSRSIPILIQLDEDYNLIKSYGPRPAEAQQLVKSLLAAGESYNIPLHTWYARNKQQALQDDMVSFMK